MSLNRRTFGKIAAVVSGLAFVGYYSTDTVPGETVRRGQTDTELSVRRTIERTGVEYIGNGMINIPVAVSGGEVVETKVVPFESWAEQRCKEIATSELVSSLASRTELTEQTLTTVTSGVENRVDVRVGEPVDGTLDPGVLVEYVVTVFDGEVQNEPAIEYDTVVDAAARTVSATVELDDQQYTWTAPVWVQRVTRGPQQTTARASTRRS